MIKNQLLSITIFCTLCTFSSSILASGGRQSPASKAVKESRLMKTLERARSTSDVFEKMKLMEKVTKQISRKPPVPKRKRRLSLDDIALLRTQLHTTAAPATDR